LIEPTAALSLGSMDQWPSRLVATAAEDCLSMSPFGGVLRFALWLAAYVVLGLLLAIFVQSLVNWLLS